MTQMRKILVLSIFIILMASTVVAQPERIGAGLTFATKKRFNGGDTGNPGVTVKTWIALDKKKEFHIIPSVSAFMPLEVNHTSYFTTTYMFHGDLDFQGRFYREKTLRFAATAGVNYRHIVSRNELVITGISDPPVDSTLRGFGPTLGLVVEMRMSSYWDFIVTARYSFTGLRPGDRDLGERFLVAPLASPVIQVQAVYYLSGRSRGYSYR